MAGSTGRSGGKRSMAPQDPMQDDGGPVCPAGLSAAVVAKWNEVVGQVPAGVLRRIDCHQLRLLSELLAGCDVLAKQIHSDPLDDKARRMFLQSCDRVNRLSAQFGLSPADRRRLDLQAEDNSEDPFLMYLAGGE